MKKVLYLLKYVIVFCALFPILHYAFSVSINLHVPIIFKYFQLEIS